MNKLFAILLFVVLLSGCTSATEKAPAVTNNKSLVSETAGVSQSLPMPQMGVSESLPNKFNVPTNAVVGIQNTNWPLYRVSWSASPSANVSYQVWTTISLTKPFTLLAATTNLSCQIEATNAAGYFKVRSVNPAGLTSRWAN